MKCVILLISFSARTILHTLSYTRVIKPDLTVIVRRSAKPWNGIK